MKIKIEGDGAEIVAALARIATAQANDDDGPCYGVTNDLGDAIHAVIMRINSGLPTGASLCPADIHSPHDLIETAADCIMRLAEVMEKEEQP